MMQGNVRFELAEAIWHSKGTPKRKLFVWLAVEHKIWTSDRRVRHGLQAVSSACFVCLQEEDTAEHILAHCVFTREVWHLCRTYMGLNFRILEQDSDFSSWWLTERSRFAKKEVKWFDGVVCAVSHGVWKNRNAWCFGNT
jgi:hypothetical protein